mmetsp:Transcript_12089/g.17617  ORF Transcript_12089/g.17617 Transcript_12089/m.17617 type:complete len:84 (+) Transcript_12089:366-617(+)
MGILLSAGAFCPCFVRNLQTRMVSSRLVIWKMDLVEEVAVPEHGFARRVPVGAFDVPLPFVYVLFFLSNPVFSHENRCFERNP